MSAMGLTDSQHRARMMAGVSELVGGGATQVYIMAATMGWRILREEEKRKIPRNLLRKMIRMKINNERVNLSEYPLDTRRNYSDQDFIPLPLVHLSHKYSLSFTTFMKEVEVVVEELWKDLSEISTHVLNKRCQEEQLPRFSTFLNVNKLTKEPNCNQVLKLSSKSSNSISPITCSQTSPYYESSKLNW